MKNHVAVSVTERLVSPGQWFRLDVIATGARVVIMVNDKITADLLDADRRFTTGFIAIQLATPQTVVEFRKLEIKELRSIQEIAEQIKAARSSSGGTDAEKQAVPANDAKLTATRPSDDFVSLFNGKNLQGWHVDRGDRGTWHAAGGNLVSSGLNDGRKQTFLLSDRDFSDFILRFEFFLPKNSDSGVVFRRLPGDNHLEVNLRNFDDAPGVHAQTAALRWMKSGRGTDYLPPDRPAELKPDGDWNGMEIQLRGGSMRVWINGRNVRTTDMHKLANDPRGLPALKWRSGRIGFQSHSGTVLFRNIEIKELSGAAPNRKR